MTNPELSTASQGVPFNVPKSKEYSISQSLRDMVAAVKKNPSTFIGTVLVSYVLAGIILFVATFALAALVISPLTLTAFFDFRRLIGGLVVGLLVYMLIYAVIYAFTTACIAYTLTGNSKLTILTALKQAAKITVRLVKVNALVAIIILLPIFAISLLSLLITTVSPSSNAIMPLVTILLVLGALVWAIIASVRYALAPFVAIFEPNLPTTATLSRSKQLLLNGGQWFIVKGFLILLLVLILLSVVTKSNVRELDNSSSPLVNIVMIFLSILAEGALVMLYLNRANSTGIATDKPLEETNPTAQTTAAA